MAGGPRASPTVVATGLALAAAFVWSSYYFFVLALQARGVGLDANLGYPFVAGGLAFLVLVLASGGAARLRPLFGEAGAYGRAGLLVAMQVLVLDGTYRIGPVDTSLLTLVSDTVLTPFLVLAIFREGRERLRSAAFFAGVAGCTVGASLTILAGNAGTTLDPIGGFVIVALPVVIAVYFLWIARLGRRTATAPLVAHATLVAAVVALVAAPLFPAGVGALVHLDPLDVALLAANGVLSFCLGPWLYFRAIRTAGMILPAVLMSTIPVFTVALGFLLDRTVPPALGLVGIPIAVLGAFLAMRGEPEGPVPTAPAA